MWARWRKVSSDWVLKGQSIVSAFPCHARQYERSEPSNFNSPTCSLSTVKVFCVGQVKMMWAPSILISGGPIATVLLNLYPLLTPRALLLQANLAYGVKACLKCPPEGQEIKYLALKNGMNGNAIADRLQSRSARSRDGLWPDFQNSLIAKRLPIVTNLWNS